MTSSPPVDLPDFKPVFEATPGLFIIVAPDLKIMTVNDAFCSATMTKRDEIVGRGVFEVFPENPDDSEATGMNNVRSSLQRVLEFRRPDVMTALKYDIRRPASEGGGFEERYWSLLNNPVFNADREVTCIILCVEDVTQLVRLKAEGEEQQTVIEQLRAANQQLAHQIEENKRLEAERARSEQELVRERDTAQRHMDVAGVMILVLNADATISLINRHGCEILGYADSREIVGKSWIDCFIPERMREPMRVSYRRLMDTGDAGAEFEFYTNPVLNKSGAERIVAWHNTLLKDDDGRVTGCLSSGDDITERLRVEESLRSNEERFRSIFGAVSEGILIVDAASGTFVEVNEPGAVMYGYMPEEMVGLPVHAISSEVPPYTQTDALKWIERAATSGKTQHFDWHGKRKDGTLIWVEVSIRLAFISGRQVVLSIARDVTDRRAMEAQLRQALKLEAIGTLAGGVAHELNNLLQPIIMMTELVVTELPKDSALVAKLLRVIDAGCKAAEIVQRILAFGRTDEVSHVLLDVALATREATAFIRTILPSSITVHVHIDESVGIVRGDKTQLTQVLINLATNARDAIGANVGAVWISLSSTDIETSAVGTLDPGRYAVLTVRDTGAGMDKATVDRIFEPFFTTKGVGKGTGLGLSVTHGIIAGHGGAIQVDSVPGRGTSFSIYLPIAEPAVVLALTG